MAVRICVVDDDASFRRLCETILHGEGFICEFATDANQAPQQIADSRPDLVIMDLRLGDADGVEVLTAIKDSSTTGEIPVLICSASRDLVDRHRGLLERLGCDVVEKPLGIDDLLAAIERCLSPIEEPNGAQ